MQFKTTNCGDGDSIDLQSNLSAEHVEPLGPDVLAVTHDEDATQATYERSYETVAGPGHVADVTVPDGAIILSMDEGHVDYLVEA